MITLETIDVTVLEPRLKHPTIFNKFDQIKKGDAFVISNDHDPKPLYYQLLAERGNVFSWEYLENGPEIWQVKIEKYPEGTSEASIGELVASDYRKAEIFKKHHIDFCCGGKKTLTQVCADKKLDIVEIERELRSLNLAKSLPSQDYMAWDLNFLVDHVLHTHHAYVKTSTPILLEYTKKLARVHGPNHPELIELAEKFNEVANELESHMQKEEQVLFPYIKELCAVTDEAKQSGSCSFGSIKNPIWMMENEHEAVGAILNDMRSMTNNYSLPEDACTTYKVTFLKLNEFEEDLHQHIHLENNIIFPKSILLENEISVAKN